MSEPVEITPPRHRVRVWFGAHTIVDLTAETALADRYEAAMRRRFAALRVTNDVLPTSSSRQPELQ